MRIYLAIAILLLQPTIAFSQEPTKNETCALVLEFASKVMALRQGGMPASDYGNSLKDESALIIVDEAYTVPLYSNEDLARKTIAEFGKRWHQICMNSETTG